MINLEFFPVNFNQLLPNVRRILMVRAIAHINEDTLSHSQKELVSSRYLFLITQLTQVEQIQYFECMEHIFTYTEAMKNRVLPLKRRLKEH